MNDLLSFFPILSELSMKAGAIIRRYYNSQIEVELKPDDSPVTQADREVEIFLRESLEKRFPDLFIRGRGFGANRKAGQVRMSTRCDGRKDLIVPAGSTSPTVDD